MKIHLCFKKVENGELEGGGAAAPPPPSPPPAVLGLQRKNLKQPKKHSKFNDKRVTAGEATQPRARNY